MNNYDYIISGAGAAGLSLLMRMMQHEVLQDKKILVVDKSPKDRNDHTWCFWETQPGIFEPVVHHVWQQVYFHSSTFSKLIDLSPYKYKMIRSIDFYNYVLSKAAACPNIQVLYGNVEGVTTENDKAILTLNNERYQADYIFNSILFQQPIVPKGKHYLMQHFKGYVIKTNSASFDPGIATLMDFRVNQSHGTTFVYVLPLSEDKALIEYTLFTSSLLNKNEYDDALKNYISGYLNIQDYAIEEEEFGVIPMTNIMFPAGDRKVINIGTAGGQTKGSSGYTFQFIQKHSDKIIQKLIKDEHPLVEETTVNKRFKMYDSIFLNVLANNRLEGSRIFIDMFRKNPAERILRFLDNESDMKEELELISTLPTLPFLKAGLQEIFL